MKKKRSPLIVFILGPTGAGKTEFAVKLAKKIGGEIIHINKKNFNIQLKNGFIIKCKDLDDAKSKAILLFNN